MVLHLLALLPTLHPIIVRRAATGDLLIKIHVAGQPVKTLQRPAADTLARSLKRVSRSFAARRKKGTHGNPEPCFLFDARGVELDPSMSALQAWSCAARLRLGVGSGGNSGEMATLDVLFEPAEVVSLVLPAVVPFIGVPLTPSIETVGCDVRECGWVWELPCLTSQGKGVARSRRCVKAHDVRSFHPGQVWERLRPGSAADGWQRIGSGRAYQPSDDDDGARLRVRAVPPAPGSAISQGDAISSAISRGDAISSAISSISALELLSRVAEAAAPVEALSPSH